MMADYESKVQELKAKIEHNKKMRDTAIQMRKFLKPNMIAQCETEIKEFQKYIDYFSEELHKLQTRSNRPPNTQRTSSDNSLLTNQSGSGSDSGSPLQSPTAPPPRSSSIQQGAGAEAPKKKFSNLDLLTTETPFNKPKVSLKLHELEYKLDVEKKVMAGIKTMSEVISRDPSLSDKKRRDEIQGQMYESMEKLNLLNRALRKYKDLYIGEGDDDDYDLVTPPSARVPPGLRRPVTGNLQLQIIEARELTHAPSRLIKIPETVVVLKIDGTVAYRTRPVRNNLRWLEECQIHVNKASEIEIVIYDQGDERVLPIGVLWLKITDIAEGLRRRKIQQENGAEWVSAEVAQQQNKVGSTGAADQGPQPTALHHRPSTVQSTQEGIEAWFDVEPVGALALRLNFVRETANRHPLDKLGRVGAVRQRPGVVHEMNGHQFVEKKFYNVMKCVLCGDFLVNSVYQCDDCEYSCCKKCYTKVVTTCISKSEKDPDEETLNHRIPHRFGPITNIRGNWCCHCGHMLPLGSRGARKCTECDITCHSKCTHLVPDFCGLDMKRANQMLAEIKAAKRKTLDSGSTASSSASLKPARTSKQDDQMTTHSQSSSTSVPSLVSDTMSSQFSQMSLQSSPQMGPGPAMSRPPQPAPLPMQPVRPPVQYPGSPPPMMPMQGQPYPSYPDPRFQQQQYRPPGLPQQMSPYAPIPNQAMMNRPPVQQMSYPPPMDMVPRPPPKQPGQPQRSVRLDDFNFLAVLGKGNFGKVMLAEEKYDKNLYAIKVLKKRFIIDNDEIESVRSEKRIFQAANRERHPFLIGLHSCFQTESRVYFVMEYVSGGDLMWHIQREPFSERRAKFYACEVLLGLEYFHSQGIVYRDLKLDNILLDPEGHIKIADYGLCKENMWYGSTTGTFCGTPEFMAPEILLEQKYGRAVDWWALGVLIYEMFLGQSPFRGEDEDEIFDAILEDEILYPINMSRDSVSICQRLLTRDPTKRLGAGPTDAAEIKEHPFFRGVSWEDMLAKRVPPPFFPTITGRLDTSNFDEEFTRERPALTPIDSQLNRTEQQEFQAFSYVADWVTQGGGQPKW